MTDKEVMQMALMAGAWESSTGEIHTDVLDIDQFADLIAAAEREECAEVCDNQMEWGIISPQMKVSAGNCADLIRARGQQ